MGCKCYHDDPNFLGKCGVCWGTKECEACSCGGDESKCDFYRYVRDRAIQKMKQNARSRTITVGSRVRFIDESAHKERPYCFPTIGTVGTVCSVDDLGALWVQWPDGATSGNDYWCVNPRFIEEVQTNADKYLRNATDEEMAAWLEENATGCPPYEGCCDAKTNPSKKLCIICWLKWLKQETQE